MHSEGTTDAQFVFSDILNSVFSCLDLQVEKLLTSQKNKYPTSKLSNPVNDQSRVKERRLERWCQRGKQCCMKWKGDVPFMLLTRFTSHSCQGANQLWNTLMGKKHVSREGGLAWREVRRERNSDLKTLFNLSNGQMLISHVSLGSKH